MSVSKRRQQNNKDSTDFEEDEMVKILISPKNIEISFRSPNLALFLEYVVVPENKMLIIYLFILKK